MKDLKLAMVKYLGVKQDDLTEMRVRRLMKLMSYYKTDSLQPSDFQRIIEHDKSPFLTSASGDTKDKFLNSMGGALTKISNFDWQHAAIK